MILSLITVVYNDVRVARALDSVLMQQLDPGDSIQIMVVDDSDDETSELLLRYGDAITVVRPPARRGMYAARNIGIQRTSGEIIGFLNADDYYMDALVLRDVLRAFRHPRRSSDGVRPDDDSRRQRDAHSHHEDHALDAAKGLPGIHGRGPEHVLAQGRF